MDWEIMRFNPTMMEIVVYAGLTTLTILVLIACYVDIYSKTKSKKEALETTTTLSLIFLAYYVFLIILILLT